MPGPFSRSLFRAKGASAFGGFRIRFPAGRGPAQTRNFPAAPTGRGAPPVRLCACFRPTMGGLLPGFAAPRGRLAVFRQSPLMWGQNHFITAFIAPPRGGGTGWVQRNPNRAPEHGAAKLGPSGVWPGAAPAPAPGGTTAQSPTPGNAPGPGRPRPPKPIPCGFGRAGCRPHPFQGRLVLREQVPGARRAGAKHCFYKGTPAPETQIGKPRARLRGNQASKFPLRTPLQTAALAPRGPWGGGKGDQWPHHPNALPSNKNSWAETGAEGAGPERAPTRKWD